MHEFEMSEGKER